MSLIRHFLRSNFKQLKISIGLNNKSFSRQKCLRLYCTGAIPHPTPDGCEKVYPTKIKNIVEEIAKLTLIEVADLNECLKKTLNIKDAPMMMGVAAAAPAAASKEEEGEAEVQKSSFTVKLTGISADKKVAIIKEVKNLIEGMNLVQAKKFVESVPQVIRNDIGKDEAEKLKQTLEAVGGTCEIS